MLNQATKNNKIAAFKQYYGPWLVYCNHWYDKKIMDLYICTRYVRPKLVLQVLSWSLTFIL